MTTTVASTISAFLPGSFSRLDDRATAVLFLVLACVSAVLPLQLPELPLVFVGAAAATLLQWHSSSKSLDARVALKPRRKVEPRVFDDCRERAANPRELAQTEPKELRQSSVCPVQTLQARSFHCTGFQAQVQELVGQLEPTKECRLLVEKLRQRVEKQLSEITPVDVRVYVSGDLSRCTAFAVAVPEIEVVANVAPAELRRSLKRMGKTVEDDTGSQKLQKLAVRVCSDQLLHLPEMKFRRSAFQAVEPKVTLLWAPQDGGLQLASLPFDFSVNYCLAQHNAALAAFCGTLQPRTRGLILLVRRWAKDRGICHAQKGYLSPYAWTLLVVFFLQGSKLLPPLRCAKGLHGPVVRAEPAGQGQAATDLALSDLFTQFFRFYAGAMEWSSEAVSLRGTPCPAQPLLCPKLQAQVAIEDPFHGGNVASTLTAEGWRRIQQELSRGAGLLETEQLTDLFEPWLPPDAEPGVEAGPPEPRAPPSAGAQPKKAPWRARVDRPRDDRPRGDRLRDDGPRGDRLRDERQYRDLGKALMQKLEGGDAEAREKFLALLQA